MLVASTSLEAKNEQKKQNMVSVTSSSLNQTVVRCFLSSYLFVLM